MTIQEHKYQHELVQTSSAQKVAASSTAIAYLTDQKIMLNYDLYKLGQAWNQAVWKTFDPVFNNPAADWVIDRQIDMFLRLWFWPGYVAEIQDNLDTVQQFWSSSFGNLCKP